MKAKVTQWEWLSFAAAVEAELLLRGARTGAVVELPNSRTGESEERMIQATVDTFLRWLRRQVAAGRTFGPEKPLRSRRRAAGRVSSKPDGRASGR